MGARREAVRVRQVVDRISSAEELSHSMPKEKGESRKAEVNGEDEPKVEKKEEKKRRKEEEDRKKREDEERKREEKRKAEERKKEEKELVKRNSARSFSKSKGSEVDKTKVLILYDTKKGGVRDLAKVKNLLL